jgi:hypothetical protein
MMIIMAGITTGMIVIKIIAEIITGDNYAALIANFYLKIDLAALQTVFSCERLKTLPQRTLEKTLG